MKNKPKLIVMLTNNDLTVKNAYDIFSECKNSKADFWGIKEDGISLPEMKELFSFMKSAGKTTFLEVVAYDEDKCMQGAYMAHLCGCDVLIGTIYSDKINDYCKKHNLKYMPFVGNVTERPSVLGGDIDDIINEAVGYIKRGVYGIDLLGYRYTGDAVTLNRKFTSSVNAPICIAGSIDSFKRIDEVMEANPWTFTIGSAFFNKKFGDSIESQINAVCDYINR